MANGPVETVRESANGGPRQRTLVRARQALLAAGTFLHIAAVGYVADDGFISFRYADHLVQGHGLVYNIGERVEGYTNFLWVLLLAGARWALPGVELPLSAWVLGSAAALVTVLLTLRFSTLVRREAAMGLLAAALVVANTSVAAWAPAGLETSLFTVLVFASAMSTVAYLETGRHLVLAAVLLGLASLTRPDGVIFFGATLIVITVAELRAGGDVPPRRRPSLRSPLLFAGVFAAVYVPHVVWRYGYYGDLFPNTAYAKVGLGVRQLARGLQYVRAYVFQYGVLLWILPVVWYLRRSRETWVWYFCWLIGVYLAYVIYVGGDGLAFHRFIAHIVPLMSCVAAAALVEAYQRSPLAGRNGSLVVAAAGIVVLLAVNARNTLMPIVFVERARWFEPQAELWFPGDGRDHSYRWFDNYFVDRLAVAARYLEQNAPPNSLVASTPAGSIAYHMHHPVLDMLGLTDKHIARTPDVFEDGWRYGRAGHEKGDGDYVLARAPDYILMGNVAVLPFPLTEETMAGKLRLKSEHELWANPEFHNRYELVSVQLSETGLFRYFTFYRKKLPQLAERRPADVSRRPGPAWKRRAG